MANRRRNNEGTEPWQRPDGRWRVLVTVPGTRQRKALYGSSAADVNQQRVQFLKAHVYDGLPVPDGRLTVAGFLRDWLAAKQFEVRASTFASYRVCVETHLVPAIGHLKVAQLAPSDVRRVLNGMATADKPLSPRTRQLVRAVLRAALQQAVRDGDLPRNVAALVSSPKVEREPVRPLSAAQGRQFLEGVRDDPLEAFYVIAFTLGLRQGEILGLRWKDIDIPKRELRVVQARLRGGRVGSPESLFGAPKSAQSRRVMALPDFTAAALERHRAKHDEARKLWAAEQRRRKAAGETVTPWPPYDLVFTTSKGTPLDSVNVSKYFKRHLARLKLPSVRFHDCRHTAASLMLEQGVPLKVISDTLGHSQISLTANTYAHVMPALKREAAAAMDRVFGDNFPGNVVPLPAQPLTQISDSVLPNEGSA